MEIQFEKDGAPVGGRINIYLLEKSRVVNRTANERAFHIFYQLLAGSTDQELSSYKLSRDGSNYAYLKASGCYKVDTINDVADWKQVIVREIVT
jgi:myosin heavy subunit